MPVDARPTLSAPDDDPYLWLEDVEGTRALAWVEEQNKRTLARFGQTRFAADRDTLAAIYDRPDNIPYVARRGAWLYNFWKDANNPRGLWRRTTLESFRNAPPKWEIVLDLDALAAKENEDWIWGGPATLPGTHDRAILGLSRGGSDAVVLREFDVAGQSFVAGGFELPEAKSSVSWLDRDTLLLSSALGQGMATKSGYARTVRLWRRGADVKTLPLLFETMPENMVVSDAVDRTKARETVWFFDKPGFFDIVTWVGDRSGPKLKLDLPTDISLDSFGDWLVVKRRSEWTVAGATHAPGTLFGIGYSAFLAGDRNFALLFAPGERRVLDYFFWTAGKLVLAILDNLQPVFEILEPSADGWTRATLPVAAKVGVADVMRLDVEEAESNGDLLAVIQDPVTPATLMLCEQGTSWQVLKRAPQNFSPEGLVVTRHEAISIDGERIPYVQVGPAKETGAAPVHLHGYGGFEVVELPQYNSAIGKLWLERGGTSVTANIRGGGEFGARWHEAGRRAGKKLSHDDFAAVAADLVKRGVTVPQRIAAEGGSNGGILITNMLTRYPERFGALFCTIPLIDMRRYSKLLAGASWVAEYGDPDNPKDWDFLQTYSAYHLAVPGKRYPPILLATSRKDDRVHPGHARKMAAKLQAMGYEAYFYEPAAGGHGYGKDNFERATFTSLGYTFLRDKIGWTPAAKANW
ncbi:MAG TPA: prolyl oligopeptidase family serine peptidase [Xanthobacteraceae bacterium]|nr:prolyl oligopeptidase family serine peptidase [Xanthobacteraceae bacterium]